MNVNVHLSVEKLMPAKSNKTAAGKFAEREANGIRNGAETPKAAKAADKPKPSPSREALIKAAKLRAEGATWNAIRTATGCLLGSSGWFKHWEREGIEHIPAGQRVKPKAEKPAPTAKSKPAAKKPSVKTPTPKRPSGEAAKPAAAA
jgi:hypothetical protein